MAETAAAQSAVAEVVCDDGGDDAAVAAAVAAVAPATKVAVLLNGSHLQPWTASICSPTASLEKEREISMYHFYSAGFLTI